MIIRNKSYPRYIASKNSVRRMEGSVLHAVDSRPEKERMLHHPPQAPVWLEWGSYSPGGPALASFRTFAHPLAHQPPLVLVLAVGFYHAYLPLLFSSTRLPLLKTSSLLDLKVMHTALMFFFLPLVAKHTLPVREGPRRSSQGLRVTQLLGLSMCWRLGDIPV